MGKLIKLGAGAVLAALIGGAVFLKTPTGPTPDYAAFKSEAQKYNARIIRDDYGVPHIFGKTDGDTAFGLAYAHAEDDWETIQDTLIGSRGMAAQFKGKGAAPTDYLFDLFKVRDTVDMKYDSLPNTVRSVAEGYAAGINLFAAEHQSRTKKGLFPVTGKDIISGVTWATPFFYRMDEDLAGLFAEGDKPQVSPWGRDANLSSKICGEMPA